MIPSENKDHIEDGLTSKTISMGNFCRERRKTSLIKPWEEKRKSSFDWVRLLGQNQLGNVKAIIKRW